MLRSQIQSYAKQFESASPGEILSWASETFGDRLAVVTSFQVTGIATLHMMQRIAPRSPVLTLDTGLLFPETQDLMDELEARFDLDLRRVKPRQTPAQQARDYGDRLWERNPDRCCHIRKTIPLRDALVGFDAWIAGLRRDQSPNRAGTPIVSRDARNGAIKIAPFANWTEDEVWDYIRAQNLPYNRLHDIGYPSIGCWTCTNAAAEDEDRRSGRWSRQGKTECGIHLPLAAGPVSEAINA
ncbi:MAG: phosphoadenylyl-sulfate reductase [Chloroflexota bacterium]|nr:phosphoadenylyl-sulfate reductase [Chloroflexota bacterium]MDE2948503.1 phosphoadenylyl-sulfate reductase [Chloroflexota bacterium]